MRIPAGPVIAIVVTVVMLVAAELLLGWLAPFPDPYLAEKRIARYVPSAHRPDLELAIEIEDGLPGVDPVHPGRVNLFHTNGYGFRGDALAMPKPADEVRVFVVGGSTTENIALDDTQDMSRLMQERLQDVEHERGGDRTWKVYNAGKSGDRSYDHLAMVSQRIAHLEPDVIVVFAGINDLMAGLFGVDYTHMSPMVLSRGRLLRLLASDSQLFRRGHAVARRFLRRSDEDVQQTIAFKTNYAEKAELQRGYAVVDETPPTDTLAYAQNLRSIAAVGKAAGARVVFMTQATSWGAPPEAEVVRWQWMRLRRGQTWSLDAMQGTMSRYNDAMREVAATSDAGLVDLPAHVEPTVAYFFDDCHFNVAGARAAALLLAPAVADAVTPAPLTRGEVAPGP
jgi:lysophospholipase L1-like esterase